MPRKMPMDTVNVCSYIQCIYSLFGLNHVCIGRRRPHRCGAIHLSEGGLQDSGQCKYVSIKMWPRISQARREGGAVWDE